MATWKKVLVSGSNIDVAQITSSVLETGDSSDKVIVINSSGHFKQVDQSLIQGTTEADFLIEGTTGTDTFDATANTMSFEGTNGATTTVTGDSSQTTVTINLPANTISGSDQVTLDQTIGFTDFSSSLAADIQTNLTDIGDNETSITSLQQEIDNLQLTASELSNSSSSIASDLTLLEDTASALDTSISSLNNATSSFLLASETGSFVISASVIGTTDEIEVSANGAQGIQIGLPDDVTLAGSITANDLAIFGYELGSATTAIIAGHTEFGNDNTDVHNFTGSLNITGALNIDNTGEITFNNITVDNTLTPSDLIVRDPATGKLHKAGTAVANAISGAFDGFSASFASDISAVDVTSIAANATDITALQTTSQSLIDSASLGIFFKAEGDTGTNISLGQTASFIASGSGLSVIHEANGSNNVSIEYRIDHQTLGNAIGAFSSSTQLQNELDSIYVQLSDAPISGAQQLQDLGFLTSSNFDQLDGVPDGLISGAAAGATQGDIVFNGNTSAPVSLVNLGPTGDPTFGGLTINGDLTVNGSTTSINTVNLNIEDQFILINSGAGLQDNNKDGGIIVDNGNGQGALLFYDFVSKAWGFKGATTNDVAYDAVSDNTAMVADVFVATVSSSNVNPSPAPSYGIAATQKGQMHINTADDTIWVYV